MSEKGVLCHLWSWAVSVSGCVACWALGSLAGVSGEHWCLSCCSEAKETTNQHTTRLGWEVPSVCRMEQSNHRSLYTTCAKLIQGSWKGAFISRLLNNLKPQDSFGEFDKFFLDLQKVQEIIRKHRQNFLQLFGMMYCNAILPNGKLSLCT